MFKMLILQHLCNLAYEGLDTSSAIGSLLCVFWLQLQGRLSGAKRRPGCPGILKDLKLIAVLFD